MAGTSPINASQRTTNPTSIISAKSVSQKIINTPANMPLTSNEANFLANNIATVLEEVKKGLPEMHRRMNTLDAEATLMVIQAYGQRVLDNSVVVDGRVSVSSFKIMGMDIEIAGQRFTLPPALKERSQGLLKGIAANEIYTNYYNYGNFSDTPTNRELRFIIDPTRALQTIIGVRHDGAIGEQTLNTLEDRINNPEWLRLNAPWLEKYFALPNEYHLFETRALKQNEERFETLRCIVKYSLNGNK